VRSGLYAGWGRSLNFSFQIVPVVTATVWKWVLSWCNTTLPVNIPLHLLPVGGFNSSSIAQYYALLTVCPHSWKCLRMGPLKSQNSINITFLAKGTLTNFLLWCNNVCFHSMLWYLPSGS
jgi:hypothetical protein